MTKADLLAEVTHLRSILAQYADPERWQAGWDGGRVVWLGGPDGSQPAREALAKGGGKKF